VYSLPRWWSISTFSLLEERKDISTPEKKAEKSSAVSMM